MLILLLNSCSPISEMSTPSIRRDPVCSFNRNSILISELLPAPVLPTMPIWAGHSVGVICVYTVHCILYTVHCTLYTVHCTLYSVHCTLYIVHCTRYTVHCTLYSEVIARVRCSYVVAWEVLRVV